MKNRIRLTALFAAAVMLAVLPLCGCATRVCGSSDGETYAFPYAELEFELPRGAFFLDDTSLAGKYSPALTHGVSDREALLADIYYDAELILPDGVSRIIFGFESQGADTPDGEFTEQLYLDGMYAGLRASDAGCVKLEVSDRYIGGVLWRVGVYGMSGGLTQRVMARLREGRMIFVISCAFGEADETAAALLNG